MDKLKVFFNRLSKTQKILFSVLVVSFIILLSISIPTIARHKNRNPVLNIVVWDGSVATSYKRGNGTKNNPYVISNGSELAYFKQELLNNNYENTYFVLSNDIKLNEGVLKYDEINKIQYILNDQTYYVKEYTNEYYESIERTGIAIGTLNNFDSLNNFKGYFVGNFYTIYGLYVTSQEDEVGLFTNLEGSVENLYLTNSLVYGGNVTGGLSSSTNGATIKNVLYNGYVVGNSNLSEKSIEVNIEDLNIDNSDYININNNIPLIGKDIISTRLTGNYVSEGEVVIDGNTLTDGSFDIDLGNEILENVNVQINGGSVSFTNLKYIVVYKESVVGGIIGNSNNTRLENVINKSDIYGYKVSGGLIASANNDTIINSYNNGKINSYISGGLIGKIDLNKENVVITNSYNSGELIGNGVGGLVGIINESSSVIMTNVFNTTNNNAINTLDNSNVIINNGYSVYNYPIGSGATTGSFTNTTITNLNDKYFIRDNLFFSEFNNDYEINGLNVWIFEKNGLPILFIDDLNNPVANINANIYSWNNLSYELKKLRIDSNITFSIEAINSLLPLKEIYYYISNSDEAMPLEQIEQIDNWVLYDGIVQITEEGNYVIYVKTVDYDDDITYLNTDILLLDLSGADITIAMDNNIWNTLKSELDYVYINDSRNLTVEASDPLSGISSIEYYITDQILSVENLNSLSDEVWSSYDNITINTLGKYVVYIKAVDNSGYVTYANTDYIIYDGYKQENVMAGRNNNYSGLNITDKSLITMDFSYNKENLNINNTTHNLVSNILLPIGTKITIFDYTYNRVYQYKISTDLDIYGYSASCTTEGCKKKATYPFTLFKEVGTVSTLYLENDYIVDNNIEEKFKVVVDFANTNLVNSYDNITVYMELRDTSGKTIRPTLKNTLNYFSIHKGKASLNLSTDFNDSISYETSKTTSININSIISYESGIVDTTYEDKNIGLSIKLVDSNNNIVDKKYYKNMIFKIGDNEYYPDAQNIIHINLNNQIGDISTVLNIINDGSNNKLNSGIYYFKIRSYTSYDGYYGTFGPNEIIVPLVVGNNNNIYGFDVIMDDSNRIINKSESTNLLFKILQNGNLQNPRIKVSLYKKDSLTAYNQDYTMIDLKSYITNDLTVYNNYVYNAIDNPLPYDNTDSTYNNFNIDLINSNFEKTGYKFVFQLYDEHVKVGTIEKYFIVK